MRKLFATLAGVLLATAAHADMYQDASNAKLPNARVNLGVDTYSPLDYGAKCDSNGYTGTNDAAAFNAMFDAIRARNRSFTVVSPESSTCYVASTINVTGLHSFGGPGPGDAGLGLGSKIALRLDCATNGTPCVDAMDTRWITWEYLYLNGIQALAPSYGIQFGIIAPGRNADLHYFNRPIIQGHYTIAAMINMASESTTVMEPFIANGRTAAGASYGVVQDGFNHFNVTSAFVTQTVPVDQGQTFNDNTFINGWISGGGTTGAPLWIGGAVSHRFINGYMASITPNCVQIFQTGPQPATNLEFQLHCETTYVQDVFRLIGPADGGVFKLSGFKWSDHNSQPSRSVFFTDPNVTDVVAQDVDIRVVGFDNGGQDNVKLFNEPNKWQVSGHIMLPAIYNWSQPRTLDGGVVCFRNPAACYPVVPTEAINRNPDFVTDQQWGGQSIGTSSTAYAITDGWRLTQTGAACTSGFLTTFRTTDDPPVNYHHNLKLTIGTPLTATAAQQCRLSSAIEGTGSSSTLAWGTDYAKPANLSVMLKASNIGTYNLAIQDASRTHSYVVTANITIANFWQRFEWPIPPPYIGSWTPSEGPGTIAAYLNVPLLTGSNYQAAANTWTAGDKIGTAGAFNLSGTAGATLALAYIHLQPNPITMPHKPRPVQQEMALAQRHFAKTFKQTQYALWATGVVGALSITLPYGQATFGSVKIPWRFPQALYSATPTMTAYSTLGSSNNCYNVTKARDSGAASFTDISDQSATVTCALVAGDALGDTIAVHVTADTGL